MSSTSSGIAGEYLPQYSIAYSDVTNSGYLYLATYNETEAKANAICMVTQSGGVGAGLVGEITLMGKVTSNSFSFSPAADLYLSTSGNLTSTKSEAVGTYVVPLGHALMDSTEIWFKPQTGWKIGSSSIYVGGPLVRGAVEGRIDIDSPTSSGTGSQLIYTPVNGIGIGLWNGYEWRLVSPYTMPTFGYSGIVLNGLTTSGGINYDIFAEYVSDDEFRYVAQAWAGDTTRSRELERFQGVLVYDAESDEGRKRRFVGTVRRRSNYDKEWVDTDAERFVSNFYNKQNRQCRYYTNAGGATFSSSSYTLWYNAVSPGASLVLTNSQDILVSGHTGTQNGTGSRVIIRVYIDGVGAGFDFWKSGDTPSDEEETFQFVYSFSSGYHYVDLYKRLGAGSSTSYHWAADIDFIVQN